MRSTTTPTGPDVEMPWALQATTEAIVSCALNKQSAKTQLNIWKIGAFDSAPTSPHAKWGQRGLLTFAACCEDEVKVTFALCQTPSFPRDECPRKALQGIIYLQFSAEVCCRSENRGSALTQTNKCGQNVTWCLVPTVSAPPGGKRLTGKIMPWNMVSDSGR